MIRRLTSAVVVLALALAVGGALGLVVVKRLRTGTWQVPDSRDLVVVTQQILGTAPPVSQVIYLDRGPRELRPGPDDAARGVSSVLAHAGTAVRRVPGWQGSDAAWRDTVACVRGLFAPFAITVTDQRPATDEFILVAVGGRPADLGVKDRSVAGLAPFSSEPIPRAVVFAFAATQRHRAQPVCETIAMEVAHAYGLDHAHLCSDVMTYLRPCGKRRFVDHDARCGEGQARDCASGARTQNSFRQLMLAVGPARR